MMSLVQNQCVKNLRLTSTRRRFNVGTKSRDFSVKVTQSSSASLDQQYLSTADASDATALVDGLIDYTTSLMEESTTSRHHLVAFSGGVDSSLVLALLQQASSLQATNGDNSIMVQPVLGISPAVSQEQVDLARQVSAHLGIDLTEVYPDEGSDEMYIANAGEACLACKTHLYTSLQLVLDHTLKNNNDNISTASLYNGTNADDVLDPTRLGLIAAANFHVLSPLQHTTKDNVRIAAKHLGLPNWNYAAAPCLRSRLALGVPATQAHLQMIEAAERVVKDSLMPRSDSNLRVRLLSKQRARIEVDTDLFDRATAMVPAWDPLFRGLGFAGIHDVRIFQSGSVSRPLLPEMEVRAAVM